MPVPVTAWLSLGGNQGDSRQILTTAVQAIAQLSSTRVCAISALYETPPWGDEDQASFHNALVKCETSLEPMQLLRVIQEIERELGRDRDPARPWGPRAIDIDILMFGDLVMDSSVLTLPHPRLTERAFILLPLVEMEPSITIPGSGSAHALLGKVSGKGIRQIAEPGWEHVAGG